MTKQTSLWACTQIGATLTLQLWILSWQPCKTDVEWNGLTCETDFSTTNIFVCANTTYFALSNLFICTDFNTSEIFKNHSLTEFEKFWEDFCKFSFTLTHVWDNKSYQADQFIFRRSVFHNTDNFFYIFIFLFFYKNLSTWLSPWQGFLCFKKTWILWICSTFSWILVVDSSNDKPKDCCKPLYILKCAAFMRCVWVAYIIKACCELNSSPFLWQHNSVSAGPMVKDLALSKECFSSF